MNGSALTDGVVPGPGLEQVNLASLTQVTNAGVAALAALPELRRITVSRCPHICESGLQARSLLLSPECCCIPKASLLPPKYCCILKVSRLSPEHRRSLEVSHKRCTAAADERAPACCTDRSCCDGVHSGLSLWALSVAHLAHF